MITILINAYAAMPATSTISTMSAEIPLATGDISGLYVTHHHWLTGWLRRRMDNVDHAEDLAQDTFVRVLTARRALYATEAKVLLATIARGLVIDHYRRCALEAAFVEALSRFPEALAPSPEARLIVLETLHQIDAMLSGLPAKVRRAFLMSQLDGLGYAEIARELKVSVSSVQQYMTRAYTACYQAQYCA